MFPMSTLMHRGLERAADRLGDRDALWAGDETWTFGDLDGLANAFARHLAAQGVGPGRPGGGHDVEPGRVRRRRPRHQQARRRRRAAQPGVEGSSRSATPSSSPRPATPSPTDAAVALLADRLGPAASPTSTTRRRWPRRSPTADRGRPAPPTRGRHRRGDPRVQLRARPGCPRRCATRTARSATPPRTGAPPSASAPTTASRWPRRRRTSSACSTCSPRPRPARPCACTAASTSTRCCAASSPTASPSRWPSPRSPWPWPTTPTSSSYDLSSLRYIMWGATPVTESVAEDVTERTGVRWLPAYGASELPVHRRNPVDEPGAWRLDSAGLPPAGVELRVVDLDTGDVLAPGEIGEIQARSPSVMAGYLPGRGERRRLRRRLVPHRRRRLARARGLGPPHRPLEGDDQGQRLPGGARPRSRPCCTATPPCSTAPCSASPTSGPARCRSPPCSSTPTGRSPTASSQQLVADSLATYKHLRHVVVVDTIPRLPSGKVLRRTLRDEWAPQLAPAGR